MTQAELSLILLNLVFGLFPFIICASTAYLKVSLVLGLLRQALGGAGLPSNLLVFILSLLITLDVMAPTLQQIEGRGASIISLTGRGSFDSTQWLKSLEQVLEPLRSFLLRNLGENIQKTGETSANGLRALILKFTVAELKEGLLIGIWLLLPFLLIDFAVANILIALGINMLTPSVVSLPLKALLICQTSLLETFFEILKTSYV